MTFFWVGESKGEMRGFFAFAQNDGEKSVAAPPMAKGEPWVGHLHF
jgi:hypothetical protein